MTTKLVLTVVGPDQPGLVSALAEVVSSHQGNWLTSEMAHLAGSFAGIVLVEVDADKAEDLTQAIDTLSHEGLLDIRVTAGDEEVATTDRRLSVQLLGNDHPGIVHEIAKALADLGTTIEEFSSGVTAAPESGGALFQATATISVGDDVSDEDVRSALEAIATEMMVDVRVQPSS